MSEKKCEHRYIGFYHCVYCKESILKTLEKLESENKRYKEALEKYADENNWLDSDYYAGKDSNTRKCLFKRNGYELAQTALREG